ncbi:MAG: hypothetical protein J6S44_03410, partial [Clostridia bacterium]|nr:hypothetical protein [Clostridia bacterium]
GYHTGYCYGINARRGSVTIQNGATIIGEVYGGDDGICAMAIGEEGETRSLSVSIFDGKFYVERDTGDGDLDHGIAIWNDCGLRIYGMTSDGIKLGRHAADTLDEYVMDGCAMTVNGVTTDPATCGTTSGYVEVYQEISEVEIYVETPVAGESATVYPEDVYWVPEGCTVDSIVWYKNGEALNLAYAPRFEAGSTYRVEVTLVADNGVRFADPLTSAEISYKKALSAEEYYKLFTENTEREIRAGITLYGPHKDDVEILLGGLSARSFASQGQQRSLAVAMKLAEGEISKKESGEYPVFLMDDLLSELDGTRSEYLLSAFTDRQVIITGCTADAVQRFKGKGLFRVEKGRYTKI